ncbi:hypothetical protein GS921_13385 [Rhodococcus hoagii]|nr:hypothetical protein [Prescottella equi]
MTAGIKFEWHKAYGASDVPSSVRSVAYVVWDYTDAYGNGAHPGIDRIVASTGLSKRQALRNLAENVARGWLGQVVSGAKSGKAGIASEYRLTYPDGHDSPVSPVSPGAGSPVSSMTPGPDSPVSPVSKPGVTSVTPTDPPTTSTAAARTAKPEPLPDDWQPNAKHQEQAQKKCLDLDAVAAYFKSYVIEHDWVRKDWDRAFESWLAREKSKPQVVPRSGNAGGRLWQE